jgi:diguanylate cyclase (GGDEF)-like protein
VLVVIVLAYLLVGALIVGFDRFPKWFYPAIAVVGTGAISLEIYFADPRADVAIFYLTVSIAVFFFFSWKQAALQVVAIALLYAGVLAMQQKPFAVAANSWLVVTGVVTTVGFLLSRIHNRVDWLVGRLDDAARTDSLTALLNRRGFEERFELELERARRSQSGLSVLVMDLDNFKQVNDQLGHAEGDTVLRELGALLTEEKRVVDVAGRLGGEEFGLLLPATDEGGVLSYAERLRTAIEVHFSRSAVALTASVGAACFPGQGAGSDDLMRAADRALYEAKNTGKNRCILYSPVHEAAAATG